MRFSLPAFFFVLSLVFLSLASPARAGDEGLYPAAPPPGSAFIRFLNGGGNASAALEVRGKSYGAAALGKTTPYVPVPHGDTQIKFGPASAARDLKEGAHYAAILTGNKLAILEEPAGDNPLKAQIVLINASRAQDVSLKTADGSVSIVEPVAPGQLGGRAINAVNAPFTVYASGKKVEDLSARPLERGERYAVVVYDGADGKPAVTFN